MRILIEVAPGELVDKITILDLKLKHITDEEKVHNIEKERSFLGIRYLSLKEVMKEEDKKIKLRDLHNLLYETNAKIWDIEDGVRDCEREKNFGPEFVELARSVYKTNDKRCELKREINKLLGSEIMEEKSYSEY